MSLKEQFNKSPVINPTETRLLISELQEQIAYLGGSLNDLRGRVALIPLNPDDTTVTPQAVNQIRNGTFSHSVNSWDDVVSADNGRYECAWWYSHPQEPNQPMYKANFILGPITLTLGTVDDSAETITITGHGLQTGTAFQLSGSIPSPLAPATVYYAIRIDADTIQVAASYANALAGTEINLTNTTTGGDLEFNYTLKDADHTEYAAEFSDWDIETGTGRFASDFDISCFLPGSNIEAGLPFYAVFSIVRNDQYVYATSDKRIFAGLYAYSTGDAEWDWLGAPFEIQAEVLGTVATPTSRDYRVLAETSRGFTILSDVLTVANAPSDADFAAGARVFLSWPAALNFGVTGYSVYRNTAGTYVLLFTTSSTQRVYQDNNGFQSSEAGWPSATFDKLVAYTATADNAITQLPYVGDPTFTGWNALSFAIRVPQNYDKSDTDLDLGQWLRFGLTDPLDYRVTGGTATNGGSTFVAPDSIFDSSMDGKTVDISLTLQKVVVSGAGTESVNGTYEVTGVLNGKPSYTNPVSGVELSFVDISFGTPLWSFNVGGIVSYYVNQDNTAALPYQVTLGWDVDAGSAPAPDSVTAGAAQTLSQSFTITSAATDTLNLDDTWDGPNSSNAIAYITDGAPPHSLSIDLAHLTYISGAGFSPNPEDISPDRGNPAAVPNGTTNPGTPPGVPPGDEDGGPIVRCLYEGETVVTDRGEWSASELKRGMQLADGFGGFNTIIQDPVRAAATFWMVETENGAVLFCTDTKKIYVSDTESVTLDDLHPGMEIVTVLNGERELSQIKSKFKVKRGVVIRISLEPGHSFLAGSQERKVLVSNRKPDDDIIFL